MFELGNLDMVLGIDWLKTLDEVVLNWKEQSMCFRHGERWVELKATSSPLHSPTSLKVWLANHTESYLGQIAAVTELDASPQVTVVSLPPNKTSCFAC